MVTIYTEKTTRIIFKLDELDQREYFVSANPETGYVMIEDGHGNKLPIEMQLLGTLAEVLKTEQDKFEARQFGERNATGAAALETVFNNYVASVTRE